MSDAQHRWTFFRAGGFDQVKLASGAVIMCHLTRFEKGERIEAWLCRVSGYVPPAAPGRKGKPATSETPAG